MTEASPILDPTDLSEIIGSHGGKLPNGLIAVSYSRLSKYQQCGEAYKQQYVLQADVEPGGSAIAGSLVHEIIEEMALDGWFRKPEVVEEWGKAEFQRRFPPALEAEGAVPVYNDDGAIVDYTGVRWGGRKRALRDDDDKVVKDENGRTIMVGENFLWFQKTAPLWIKRAGSILRSDVEHGEVMEAATIERRVAAWLDGPGSVLITGIIDVMLLATEDGPKIRDWKTGAWMPGPMQLANYAWLLNSVEEESMRIDAKHGEMIYLRGTTKESWVKSYNLEPLRPLVPRMFTDMLAGVEAGIYQLVPSNLCGSCWVRMHCPYGKTLEA